MPQRLFRTFAAAVGLTILAAPAAVAQDKLTVLLDWFVNPNHGPIVIAETEGYFDRFGLDVAVSAPSDPSLPPTLVAAGQADIAVAYQPQLHLQVEEGLPLRRIGTLIATPLNCLMVRADSGLASAADLAGRKIGYSVAGVEEALMTALLAPAGLSLDDVELINVNWSLSPSLMSGQVDAVIGAYRNFELTQMRLEGVEGRCLALEEHGVPVFDELIYVANAEALEDPAKRDAYRRFLAAVELATLHMLNAPDETWARFSATAAELQDELNETAWRDTLPRFALRPAALDQGRYRAFSAFLADAALIPAEQPVSAVAVDLGAID